MKKLEKIRAEREKINYHFFLGLLIGFILAMPLWALIVYILFKIVG